MDLPLENYLVSRERPACRFCCRPCQCLNPQCFRIRHLHNDDPIELVNLEAIEEPPQDFTSVEDLFAKTLAHEKNVTAMIKDLDALAAEEKDEETGKFLQWFVKEQEEEEATPAGILAKLEGKDDAGVKEVDSELSKRTFNLS